MSNTTTSSVVNCQARAYDFLVRLVGTRPDDIDVGFHAPLAGPRPPSAITSSS